jgi:hypothetical protein
MTNSLYIIGPKSDYEARYDYYVAKGYDNRGSVRISNDGTKVLLEEDADMFEQEDLDKCEFTGTNAECQAYINARPDEWQTPEEETPQ